jgi:capsular polysaccharide biosynthesis protein
VSLLSGDAARKNYYDWLFHCLPRLELINQVFTIDAKAKFLVPNDEFEFQKYTLDFFGVTAERRLDASFFRFVRADELIVVQHPNMRPERMPSWIAEFLRKKFLPLKNSHNQRCGSRRIFLSRQDASARRMINESDLYGYLELLGFEKVEASKLSFREQVDLFADAEIVVGVHGAGLANLVFAPQGTAVFEIFPSKSELPFFSRIAQMRGLSYACVHGEPQQQLQNVNQADFILSASRMRALFESAKDVCAS